MKAIIVGGGIGGLTTALMLRARGIDCELFEQSDTIRELGVGINTLPHAIRELTALGLLDRLDAAAVRTDQLYYLNRARRHPDRCRRHSFAGARDAVSGRGAAVLERLDAVARRARLAGVPDRPLDDRGRRAERQ